jgi:outer membrane protein TolC
MSVRVSPKWLALAAVLASAGPAGASFITPPPQGTGVELLARGRGAQSASVRADDRAQEQLLARGRGAQAAQTPAPRDTLRLPLDEAVRLALQQGEEMRGAHAFVRQTEGRVLQELSRALPHVSGTITYDRKLSSIFQDAVQDTSSEEAKILSAIFQNSSFAAKNTWSADLTAEQLLWSGGKVGAALRTARAANRSARASENEAASDLTYQVKQAYYDAAYAERLVGIAERGLEQARRHLQQVQSGQREGSKSEYDLLRAEVDAANQEPAVVAAERGHEIALLALKRFVNVPLDQPLVLATPLAFEDDLVPVVTERSPSLAERPALAAADYEVEARRQVVRVYRGQYWPDLTISSTVSHQAFPSGDFPTRGQFRRNWDAYLKLQVPIFSGLHVEGQVSQARGEYEKARADRDRLRELVAIEAAQARADLDHSLSTLVARRETVRQARRAWELAGVRYTNGMSTQIEVSDARLQLQTAEVNEVQATRDYLVALARLEQAVGHQVPVVRKTLDEATQSLNLEGTH